MGHVMTNDALADLLHDCGVQMEYEDVCGEKQQASTETLLALLRTLGVEIKNPDEAGEILRERRLAHLRRGVEPVLVAWDGQIKPVQVSLPAKVAGPIAFELDLGSQKLGGEYRVEELDTVFLDDDHSLDFVMHKLPLPERLPPGYHRLSVRSRGQTFQSLVISAPTRAFNPAQRHEGFNDDSDNHVREWGAFLPLYALRYRRDWGAGDFTALAELAKWTGRLGGSAVGTLPLLAASLDEPFEWSPYRPVSRQFWNEFYVDVESVPELQGCSDCREVIASQEFRRGLDELRSADTVDYRQVMWLKRQALVGMAAYFFDARPASRFGQFQKFLASNPEVEAYARFRAAMDREHKDWLGWPAKLQQQVCEEDVDPADVQYHQYVQWIAAEQLAKVKTEAEAEACGLYLDLPVGVDPGGYDVWRNKDLFVLKATTGAPPDAFFTKGQDWGLPPLHPERLRESGYRLLRQVLSANMRFAHYLRIDHAMGWHRLYCIPQGAGPGQGAYVRYPAEEFYAVASLESHRHECTLLAENLGTVAPEVNEKLHRHGIGAMWVAPYELEPSRRHALSSPPKLSVASLNTHDMPPAAAWWQGLDIPDRQSLGLLNHEQAEAELLDRQKATRLLEEWLRQVGAYPLKEETTGAPPIAGLLRALAASPAQLLLVNLEDLWLETRSQNVPGTSTERPNWQRKARYSLEEFTQRADVIDLLTDLTTLRQTKPTPRVH
jgi:4-alpha-glucanotransferase